MGNSVVKVGNSEIQVSDNRAASIIRGNIQPEHMAPVVRFDDCRVSYSITNHDARRQLAQELLHLTGVVFYEVPNDRTRIHQQRADLEEAVGLLAKDLVETLLVRQDTIQYYLNELVGQMQEIIVYGHDSKNSVWELMITRSLKKLIKNMNNATNRSVTLTEFPKLAQIAEVDADSLRFEIDFSPLEAITFGDVSDDVRNVFSFKELDAGQDTLTEDEHSRQMQRTDLLYKLSPDALAAFTETELLIAEVAPLATTPEDEYFMEQIEQDYYLHIFAALEQFEGSAIDFEDKETVVLESIKQFKIIQLGLQKIIDSTVARKLSSIKSQTDFLRNKVLGENALSLTSKESEDEVEKALVEAARIREELYKKHVTPILEKNKSDYDAALEKDREEYEEQLLTNRASYETLAWNQKTEFDKQVIFYKEENILQKMKFDEELVQQKADFDAQLAANKKELVSDYKKELALRTEGFKKSVRALKDAHSAKIALLQEDNARVLGKYQELLPQAREFAVAVADYEEAYDRLEKNSAHKLNTYKGQIDTLKVEIDRLEALAISFIGKDALPPIYKGTEETLMCVGSTTTNAEDYDYDPWQSPTLRALTKKQEAKVQEEVNEAKQLLESQKKQQASIWDNGQRLLTSDEMRDESYWSESYFDEM